MTITIQVNNLEIFLNWLKKCPFVFTISSMQGGFVHVKFLVPVDESITIGMNNREQTLGET